MERNGFKEAPSKNVATHPVHRTTLRYELGEFDDPSAMNFFPAYSVGPKFRKDVPYHWILNFRSRLGFCDEAL